MQTNYLTIHKYHLDIPTNKAKKLLFPSIRGTWLPCFDPQYRAVNWVRVSPTITNFESKLDGIAINWLGVRIVVVLNTKLICNALC